MANATPLENLVGNMNLDELAQRSGRSIEAIVAFAFGTKSSTAAPARPSTSSNGAPRATRNRSPAARPTATTIDTRTRQGRAELDAEVLDAIKTLGSAKADDLASVGGDIAQRRAALHRLIASRKIKREGKARGTVYKAK